MLVDQNMCFADAPLCAQGSGSHPGDADSEGGRQGGKSAQIFNTSIQSISRIANVVPSQD